VTGLPSCQGRRGASDTSTRSNPLSVPNASRGRVAGPLVVRSHQRQIHKILGGLIRGQRSLSGFVDARDQRVAARVGAVLRTAAAGRRERHHTEQPLAPRDRGEEGLSLRALHHSSIHKSSVFDRQVIDGLEEIDPPRRAQAVDPPVREGCHDTRKEKRDRQVRPKNLGDLPLQAIELLGVTRDLPLLGQPDHVRIRVPDRGVFSEQLSELLRPRLKHHECGLEVSAQHSLSDQAATFEGLNVHGNTDAAKLALNVHGRLRDLPGRQG